MLEYITKNPVADFTTGSMNCNWLLNLPPTIPNALRRFSSEAIERSVKWAMHDNKIGHIFKKKRHGMHLLLDQVNGDKEMVVRKVIASVSDLETLPAFGKFENFRVMIMGYEIDVSGFISDGVIKLGTVFIPEELQK